MRPEEVNNIRALLNHVTQNPKSVQNAAPRTKTLGVKPNMSKMEHLEFIKAAVAKHKNSINPENPENPLTKLTLPNKYMNATEALKNSAAQFRSHSAHQKGNRQVKGTKVKQKF